MTRAVAHTAEPQVVEFRKLYADSPYGQLHVLTSEPTGDVNCETPVACFAPNPSTGRSFQLFMQCLGQDRRVVAPDYPGLGRSDAPPFDMAISDYAGAMASVLEALGYGAGAGGPVDVCGYHTGTYVALELAVTRPDLVRKVVLIGIPYYDAAGRERERKAMAYVRTIEEDFDSLRNSWDFAVTNREQGVTMDRAYEQFIDVLIARKHRHMAYNAAFDYDVDSRAGLLQQPLRVLNPDSALQGPTQDFMALVPEAMLVDMPELHYGIFDVAAKQLTKEFRRFLDT